MTTPAPLDGDAGELLDVVNEQNELTGARVLRKTAHKTGVLHRTVYVLLTRAQDGALCLLLQRRTPQKAICPSCWDLSAAEHLARGESYMEAALRGLLEELGVLLTESDLREALPPSLRELRVTSTQCEAVLDREFVATYRSSRDFDGAVTPDQVEVSEVRWVSLAQLREEMSAAPDAYTPWLRDTLALLDI